MTDAELKAAILEILQAKASSILQLARRLHQDVDCIQDAVLDMERRGIAERVPLATPWRVTQFCGGEQALRCAPCSATDGLPSRMILQR